ncbi:MAG: hypothetical protein AMXMBFR64_48170 [Myxococcales bacterium]
MSARHAVAVVATFVALGHPLLVPTASAAPYGHAFREIAEPVAITDGRALVALARAALEAAARGEPLPEPPTAGRDPAPFGVFVTAVRDRKVRGCFGRLDPGGGSVAEMVIEAAHGAARLDVRNRPIMPGELRELDLIVSLVGPIEPIESTASLDPWTMGLLVRADSRAAVLLPGEARTARWQVAESRRKAGIAPGEPVQMFRFPTITLIEHELFPSKGDTQ